MTVKAEIPKDLLIEWKRLKQEEQDAAAERKNLEEQILEALGAPNGDIDGTLTIFDDGNERFQVKGNLSYSVDEVRLREMIEDPEIAVAAELLLQTKHYVNLTAFKNVDASIVEKIRPCVTAKYIRPTFTLKNKGKE